MKIVVTGAAGFIGMHTVKRLLDVDYEVIGLDNLNDYYDIGLKRDRLKVLEHPNFYFYETGIENGEALFEIMNSEEPQVIIHLAAQAGVRHSIEHPDDYAVSNLTGFLNILEAARNCHVDHLIYASSSSVYGANNKIPFSENDIVEHPISLYAATKRSNELMAYTYSHLYGIPISGLRFFTVYGPWGRPDMAYYKFTEKILSGEPISVFNYGDMKRDFTYIDDVVDGIVNLIHCLPSKSVPHEVYNVGNNDPVSLMRMINILEEDLGKKATIEFLPMQPGDVKETYASIDKLHEKIGYKPKTSLEDGLSKFVDWYKSYYR
ncbi:NAD-dependent epimerase/dehydratase family protein [Marinicrinis lubricantis]|uniref:NAD-dependent epimerase/dehydratase family protein n=1 Tax=Marinicrinis lubricantis TaxID=2086470 RepID=A0ABW1IKI5_9BACL